VLCTGIIVLCTGVIVLCTGVIVLCTGVIVLCTGVIVLCTGVHPVTACFMMLSFFPYVIANSNSQEKYKLQREKVQFILTTSLTECNSGTTQKFPIWSQYHDCAKNYIQTTFHNNGTIVT
jgi:hypothetical protein